jgi:hypothetical protein
MSCEKDENCSSVSSINFRVNHYQNTGFGEGKSVVLMVQDESNLFSGEWLKFYDTIEGFDFIPGFVYNLNLNVTEIPNPTAGGSSLRYELEEVVSTFQMDVNATFEVDLKIDGISFVNMSDDESGFQILNQINCICSNNCEALTLALNQQDYVTGIFKRISQDTIELISFY